MGMGTPEVQCVDGKAMQAMHARPGAKCWTCSLAVECPEALAVQAIPPSAESGVADRGLVGENWGWCQGEEGGQVGGMCRQRWARPRATGRSCAACRRPHGSGTTPTGRAAS